MAKHKDGSHEDIEKRLARIAGHAESLKRFWKEERDPDDVLVQVAAVRAALDQVAKAILLSQIESALTEVRDGGKADKAVKDIRKCVDRVV